MYNRIVVGLDGSKFSDYAMSTSISLAQKNQSSELIGCHVYASRMHEDRFQAMEPGLPERYQTEEQLGHLRKTHDGIITDGMRLISDAYLDVAEKRAKEAGVVYRKVTPEGRNYVKLLEAVRKEKADLLVLGASGQGHVPECQLGSLTERSLLFSPSDVLVMRKPWPDRNNTIVVGVDGSEASFCAFLRAAVLAKTMGCPLEAVAVYDPYFHTGVFRSVSGVLSQEAAQRFNFTAQERLHDEIIDKGLESLYREALDKAVAMGKKLGIEVQTRVLAGKVYPQIHHYASLRQGGLVVVGRWGLHREELSLIGSNSHYLCRICHTNVLVVSPFSHELLSLESGKKMAWNADAEAFSERVPSFARGMARRSIEDHARQKGHEVVTLEDAKEVALKLGMERSKEDEVGEVPSAEVVVLTKIKRLAPDFHRHILKSKVQGQVVGVGDNILVYRIEETVPSGRVKIVDSTHLEFR